MAASSDRRRMLSHDQYTIAWISPLKVERIAALAMLDEEHRPLSQPPPDQNVYTLGRIGHHNIVIAGLDHAGNVPAASAVSQMTFTFQKLRFGLLVGIGGGVPFGIRRDPVRLGDVVVGAPQGIDSGTIQYDYGKALAGGFERSGVLRMPPTVLLKATETLQIRRDMGDDDPVWRDTLRVRTDRTRLQHYAHPGAANDHLYNAEYVHREPGKTCHECGCDPAERIPAPVADIDDGNDDSDPHVTVHRGMIASGGMVIKDAMLRDKLAQRYGVLCFEMEAAGVLHNFPCIVIRGISDYCDSHKNDVWHGFAAAAAASYARQLFSYIPFDRPANDSIPRPDRTESNLANSPRTESPSRARSPASIETHDCESAGDTAQLPSPCSGTSLHDETATSQSTTPPSPRIGTSGMNRPSMTQTAKSEPWDGLWIPGGLRKSQHLERNIVILNEQSLGMEHAQTRESQFRLALALYELKEYEEAEAWLRKIYKKEAYMLILHGRVLCMQAKHCEAENILKQILDGEEGAQKTSAYFELARMYEVQKKQRDCESVLRELATRLSSKATDDGHTTEAKYNLGAVLHRRGNYQEAEKFLREVSEVWLVKLGDRDAKTLSALHLRGMALSGLAMGKEAIEVLRKAADGRNETLGPKNAETLASLHCLGRTLIDLEQDGRAEPYLRKAADGRSQTLGPKHAGTLDSLDLLGTLLSHLGKYDESESVLRRAAHGRLEVLGPMHKDTLQSLSSLGDTLRSLKRYEQSWSILERASNGQSEILGLGHQDTLWSLHSLGVTLWYLRRYTESKSILTSVVEWRLKIFGPKHEQTLDSQHALGTTLNALGKYAESEMFLRNAVEGRLEVSGLTHMLTLDSLYVLGITLQGLNKHADSEMILRLLVNGRSKVLGFEHQATLESLCDLGVVFQKLNKYDESEKCLRQSAERGSEVLGPTHFQTLSSLDKLSELLVALRKYDEAKPVLRKLAEGRLQAQGKDSTLTTEAFRRLGLTLKEMKEWKNAARAMRIAVDGLSRSLGKEYEKTLWYTNELGLLLMSQGDHTEAEALFRSLVEAETRTAGSDHSYTIWSTFRLGCVLMAQDPRSNEAEKLMRSLLERERLGINIPLLTLMKHSELLYHQDRLEEAENVFDKFIGTRATSKHASNSEMLVAQDFLGRALYKQGKFSKATAIFEAVAKQRAQELGEQHELTKQARRRHRKASLH